MTSRDRVRMALSHQPPDRVPVGEFEIEFTTTSTSPSRSKSATR